ncbi:Holliday junction branch migration DNA helicase RuvB [Thermosulfuriphilus ammonigenes]|uniref:Holliday junction branch migration complex subunit RuvB n=1 Tax=Thermosulfuriphilus ammonigenes TaxID=1936021 RepID=A0A6G7PTA1_9BACT|nr:Holliday junction branch migration DNA helicase RuvB [Thermosulfuriphilus ammonigenes]MBA2849202.1 Holliday junction DNA helicase RuvB [Thermosulfuriphilus ammonigenes]QIJ70817.1 Holliday junction branch migration DNA helicase RuvB [Thermosulfuriphilus ammonigenes]
MSEMDLDLRPKRLAEYIGQEEVKRNLSVFIEAARVRGEPLDHVLLYGHPGLGKTTLAYVVSRELNVNIKVTSGPVIERAGDLAAILTNLSPGDVLFIDEIHRLSPAVEEILYPAMEDFRLDIMVGQGPGAKSVRISLPRFTLIGATTRAGLISAPLRDRFGVVLKIDFYSVEELAAIVERSARIMGIDLDRSGALEIARRSRGTPRVANRLLRRVCDFALVEGHSLINAQVASRALGLMEVDERGLDRTDRRILMTIIEKFGGGPVGIETLATALCEDRRTLEDLHEPFLIQRGYLKRTKRGRVVTPLAYEHLGVFGRKDELFDS